MDPLSNVTEQLAARRIADYWLSKPSAGANHELAGLLLRALDQIAVLTRAIPDPMAARLQARGHRYPALVAAGHGDWWLGPGLNDFAPQLVRGAIAYLRKRELLHDEGAARTYIRNRLALIIRDPEGEGALALGALEDCWALGAGRGDTPAAVAAPVAAAPFGAVQPKRLADLSPEEYEQQQANLRRIKKALNGG